MQASPPARAAAPAIPMPAIPAPAIAMPAIPAPASTVAPTTVAPATVRDRTWDVLRAMGQAGRPVPRPVPGRCRVCTGPARRGYARCFQCELHAQCAPGLLADAVAPVAYAAKGSGLARDLWLYKAGRPASGAAASRLLLLLLVFLHDHGPRVWRQAGLARPSHVCVVPSGRGRAGFHPLQALAAPYLALPWVSMYPGPASDPWARSLDGGRFRTGQRLAGAGVLLLDDTWASGASAQSAAVALKRAGARSVAAVVIGRHVQAAGPAPPARGQ
ncbi:MAG TPA: hypothetical protein VEC76_05775 [Streptosporangiaceae bacterium]|nr:hypothetical protein [Streptosporangiaceae bacterium]